MKSFSITKKVYPGETALAFYTATNETNEPIIGKNHNFSQKYFLAKATPLK